MSQPEKITPSYLGPAGQESGPTLYSALKHQVLAPEYRDDNLRYAPPSPSFVALDTMHRDAKVSKKTGQIGRVERNGADNPS
jgi:hypothetical protein